MEQERIVSELARFDFSVTCGCDCIVDGTVCRQGRTICGACFSSVRDEDARLRRAAVPLSQDICGICGIKKSCRRNIDMNMFFCDGCFEMEKRASLQLEAQQFERVFRQTIVMPDQLTDSLFIGPKESGYSVETLKALGITQVLICCDHLPAPHAANRGDDAITYHRLPLADSLAQDLKSYLPSALAFIARGALRGEKTLVHCNAGVSRSGAIAVEWIRRTIPAVGGDLDHALAFARTKRSIITPNANFLEQLREQIREGKISRTEKTVPGQDEYDDT